METLPAELWASIYSFCSVEDWNRSHLVCKDWNCSVDCDVIVRRAFLNAGGPPSKSFESAGEYKERIFKRLRFGKFLNDPQNNRYAKVESFNGMQAPAEGAFWGSRNIVSLARAGMPEYCLVLRVDQIELVHSESGVRKTPEGLNGQGRLFWPVPFQLGEKAQLAALSHSKQGLRVHLFNLKERRCIATKNVSADIFNVREILIFRSLVYFPAAPTGPELILLLRKSIIRLNVSDLTDLGSIELEPKQWRIGLTVADGLLRLQKKYKLCPVDLEMGVVQESVENFDELNSTITCEVGNRDYHVIGPRDGSDPRIFGYHAPLPDCPFLGIFIGGRWGDHDYLIYGPGLGDRSGSVGIWRGDDTVMRVELDALLSHMPLGAEKRLILESFRLDAEDRPTWFGRLRLFLSDGENWGVLCVVAAFAFVIYSMISIQIALRQGRRVARETEATMERARLVLRQTFRN